MPSALPRLDRDALATALSLIAALGGDQEADDLRGRSAAKAIVADALSKYAALGANPSAPSLALFRALESGPRALASACKAFPRGWIDLPFASAAAEACRDPLPRAACLAADKIRQSQQFTALQICAHFDLWREASILLSRGADSSLFHCGVTSTGLAAYMGHPRTLARMRAFGADLRLELGPAHADASSLGSTLLHRVGERDIEPKAKAAIGAILASCKASYPDLEHRRGDGLSAAEAACGAGAEEFKAAIRAEMALRESEALRESTPPAPPKPAQRI